MKNNIPDRYRYQMNSDISPYEAWNEQRKKLQKRIQNQYDIEDIKKELQYQMEKALFQTIEEGQMMITKDVVNNILTNLDSLTNGGKMTIKNSFATNLGAMLGRELGKLPFKMLDDILMDDRKR